MSIFRCFANCCLCRSEQCMNQEVAWPLLSEASLCMGVYPIKGISVHSHLLHREQLWRTQEANLISCQICRGVCFGAKSLWRYQRKTGQPNPNSDCAVKVQANKQGKVCVCVCSSTAHPPRTTLMDMVSCSSQGVASMTSLRTSILWPHIPGLSKMYIWTKEEKQRKKRDSVSCF